ncbi:MAG: hypothetical protein JHC33_14295, partial [Ignisphaera sp.]|nr:hypothetical protein [Ignisphaera sp.]
LAQDKVLLKELIEGLDVHGSNQAAFGLPSRLIAKVFVFRLIYGGSAYSYANDPDFAGVSKSEKYWQSVIDKFYDKYKGIANWHQSITQEVIRTGKLTTPTGRRFTFEAKRNYKGELQWPITTIKNYPVQSLGADIMSLIRVSFRRRFKNANIDGLIVNTVHDSIVVDCSRGEEERVTALFNSVFSDAPANFNRIFGVEFNLPLLCEVSKGNNMKEAK